MISRLFLFLIVVILLSKSGILPELITQMIEQTINILLGILFVITVFLIAPVWVGLLSAVLVSAWLFIESPTQGIGGNGGGGNVERISNSTCRNILTGETFCCDEEGNVESGICIIVTGHEDKQ